MSLTKSPYEIVNPKDRWIPTIEKDLSKFLPPLVLKIREEVFEWRKNNYNGASNTTKSLLNWWFNNNP